uniref:Ketoreductase domain-containing protein n=1 Tax=Globisporangium ultimum (strain ATCC 200006 / CBS 805.95 / DAOM BR144) TaxID=431595 RepID=K3WZV9_GLOUD
MSGAKKTEVPDKWDATKIPSLKDKVAIVTGANSGIGYETALELARKGANVVLACRSEERGKDAEARMRDALAGTAVAGDVTFAKLDVSSLKSVEEFCGWFLATHDRLNLLINNAGIMAVPRSLTVDGYERQFATNHLGHFALTARLFGLLQKSAPSRVVNVSSIAHYHASKFNEDQIMMPAENYSTLGAYADSKLCNILFMKELDRRIKAAGITGVTATVAHPGTSSTNLGTAPATENSFFVRMLWKLSLLLPITQAPEMGALPSLYAATAPNVKGGDFFGPKGFMKMRGYPTLETPSEQAESETAGDKLWTLSEKLTKLSFDTKK